MARILIIASGGGHTGYALALLEALKELNCSDADAVIPENDEWTKSLIEKYVDNVVEVKKLRRPDEDVSAYLRNLPKALLQSLKLGRYKVVIATGSNHSFLPAIISKIRGAQVYVIEAIDRFCSRSRTVSLLTKFGAKPVVHFLEQKSLYPSSIVVGPILRRPRYSPKKGRYILAVGAFEGDKEIYDALSEAGFKDVVIQTGKLDPEPWLRRNPGWIGFRFDPDLERWISEAEIVIGHVGVTIAEAAILYKKPTIIYVNPRWRGTSKFEDIVTFGRKLNSIVITDVKELVDAVEKARSSKPPEIEARGAIKLAEIICEDIQNKMSSSR